MTSPAPESGAAGDGAARPAAPAEDYLPDLERRDRVGVDEAIFCSGKSPEQIGRIVARHHGDGQALLLTRLDEARHAALPDTARTVLDYDSVSRTAILGAPDPAAAPSAAAGSAPVAVVTAGTSDVFVAREATRTLEFHGCPATEINDVGVAGLWRLLERLDELRRYPVIIAVAGMDAALPTVLGGQVRGAVIAVPTSTGYGVAEGGRSALDSLLASCAPGVTVVNIDNGYGAACAALRMVNMLGEWRLRAADPPR